MTCSNMLTVRSVAAWNPRLLKKENKTTSNSCTLSLAIVDLQNPAPHQVWTCADFYSFFISFLLPQQGTPSGYHPSPLPHFIYIRTLWECDWPKAIQPALCGPSEDLNMNLPDPSLILPSLHHAGSGRVGGGGGDLPSLLPSHPCPSQELVLWFSTFSKLLLLFKIVVSNTCLVAQEESQENYRNPLYNWPATWNWLSVNRYITGYF